MKRAHTHTHTRLFLFAQKSLALDYECVSSSQMYVLSSVSSLSSNTHTHTHTERERESNKPLSIPEQLFRLAWGWRRSYSRPISHQPLHTHTHTRLHNRSGARDSRTLMAGLYRCSCAWGQRGHTKAGVMGQLCCFPLSRPEDKLSKCVGSGICERREHRGCLEDAWARMISVISFSDWGLAEWLCSGCVHQQTHWNTI